MSQPQTTINDVLAFVHTSATPQDVTLLYDALRDRQRSLRASQALTARATVVVGTAVTISGISPKALSGSTGDVTLVGTTRADVRLSAADTARLRFARTGKHLVIPNGVDRHVVKGIPLQCLTVV